MYKLSEAASQDIERLLDQSIIDFGLLQTEAYYNDLTHCLSLLAENPEMGTGADDIRAGYRRFPHESHLIFYTIQDEHILIIRILHKRMDVSRNILRRIR